MAYKKKLATTHVRILKKDKSYIDGLVKKGFFPNTATAINRLLKRRK